MSLPITADSSKDMGEAIRYPRPTPPAPVKFSTAKGEKTGPWRKSEDYVLERWVEKRGPADWVGAALLIPGRTSKQCRERWHQNLNPALNHEPICEEEGNIIVEMVQQKGKKWAEIAREMRNNRSDNAIKNYWNGWNNCRKRQQRSASSSAASASSSLTYPPHRHESPFTASEKSLPPYTYPRTSYQQPQHHLSAHGYQPSAQESSIQQRHQFYHSHHLNFHASHASAQRQPIATNPSQPAPGRPAVAMIASPASSTPSTEMGSTRLASCSPIERTFVEFTPSPRSSVTEPSSFTTSRRSSVGLPRMWQGGPALQSVPRTPQMDVWQRRLAAPTNSGTDLVGSPQWHLHGTGSQTQLLEHAGRPKSDSSTAASLRGPSSGLSPQQSEALLFHSHQMPRSISPSRRTQDDWDASSQRPSGLGNGDHDAKRRKISVAAICN